MFLLGCGAHPAPIDLEARSPDGSQVHISLTYPAASCPSATPAPCYRYLIRFTPAVDFDTAYTIPALPPNAAVSPLPAATLWAHLEAQLQRARHQGQRINLSGVDRYLDRESRGAFPSVCALRVALDPPAYGRISLHFVDEQGHSQYRRDTTDTLEQFLAPGWSDPADEAYRTDSSWYWAGSLGAEALPLEALRHTLRLQLVLLPGCRSVTLPTPAG